jgi:hypothetical protein
VRELIAWGGCDPDRPDCHPIAGGCALDASTRAWTVVPPASSGGIDPEVVWTGREAVFFCTEGWEQKGVACDPTIDSWRAIADGPVGLILTSCGDSRTWWPPTTLSS